MTTIEPARGADDIRASVELLNRCDPDWDADVEGAQAAASDPARLDLIARDGAVIVGMGFSGPIAGDPSAYEATVQVVPTHRRAGIGSTVLAALGEHARAGGVDDLEIEVRDHAVAGRAFLAAHRFVEIGREASVALDLVAPAPATGAPAGVAIVTRADRPELAEGMYHVALEAEPDIPADEPRGPGTFAEWRALNLDRPARRPELTFIALAGGEVVGYAILHAGPGATCYHGMTGVRRAWRGRGIASALKRAQIAAARAAGFRRLVTENELRNDPIRRLNDRLGYVPVGETIFLRGPAAIRRRA